ncbi:MULTISPECIES: 3-isopropylmalate dehydrogenase [Lysinibacillus]|uniref:3-isopropylmalate dehydrogenase n=1 Tax=Lysinibacillus TaxID=400634 RepID=UPI0021526237|nr:3-isopropylmalate dehydrogenase [Lysinibacillus capsici]MCR6522086.1 3-isopropylmalate dehydrogenase [Lysinibacillus capsici]
MEGFFFILIGFLIVTANVIGFVFYKKKKNLYNAAFIILLLAGVFGGLGGVLALIIIRDPFALFYGLNIAYYLLINSLIVFILAILVTIIKKYTSSRTI